MQTVCMWQEAELGQADVSPLPSLCSFLTAVPDAKVWEEEFDLNSVRLCMQASITLSTGEQFPLEPVVSQPIYDNSEWAHMCTYIVY